VGFNTYKSEDQEVDSWKGDGINAEKKNHKLQL